MTAAAAQPVRESTFRRWLGRGVVALVVLALAVTAYSCFWPHARDSYTGSVERFRDAGVTYLANGPLYVVAQPDGSFLALDEQDRVYAHHTDGCVVRWDVATKLFQEDQRCGGATFNLDGSPRGQGLPLLRHPIRLAGKNVVVDIRQCIAPEQGAAASPRPCSDYEK